jgi:hypothetical protein
VLIIQHLGSGMRLRLPRRVVYVPLNIMQLNGQLLPRPDGGKPKGNYTGERLSGRKGQAIINALARGEPITLIAKRLCTSHETVRAMRDREYAEISSRKQLIAASAARLAANGFDRLNAEMDAGNIKGALLVPVTGMAIDKVIALSGDATARLMNLNVNIQPVDLVAQFEKLHAAIRERRVKENPSMTRHQLALPGGETISDSGAETGLQSGKENS